jgi:CRISPR-associated exonuclease Cas4
LKDVNEDEYLMLSGVQHFVFCPRQWALIHIEQQWAENVKTIEGQYVHQKADEPFNREKRKDKLVVRAMPVKSHELQATGICDVVEFVEHPKGITLMNEEGTYQVVPVEYKRGKPKKGKEDLYQLVAQAICLEEMFVCDVPFGFFFYDEIKRREKVEITESIKEEVKQAFKQMHLYYNRQHTPKVKMGKHCASCSLEDLCIPELNKPKNIKSYMERFLQ